MKKKQILTLNNIVFKIAQKQDIKSYLSIMNYSDFLNKENEKYVEEAKKAVKFFKTEKKEYKNDQGQMVEYFAVPVGREDEANEALEKIGSEDFTNKPKGKAETGKSMFYSILKNMTVSEITGETTDDKEVKTKNYNYAEQLIMLEILDEN